MSFKVTARTVLQLGAELISSDAVAFYELIKNSFDARARRVDIDVVVRMPNEDYLRHRDVVQVEVARSDHPLDRKSLALAKGAIAADLDAAAPRSGECRSQIEAASTWRELAAALDESNYIEIADGGTGMTRDDLREIYLTIGTRHRQRQRLEGGGGSRPILGEKGLGRLSSMRLANLLRVETSVADEGAWNVLEIDWRWFSRASDAMIEDITVEPTPGPAKPDAAKHGTRIRLSALTSGWTRDRVAEIAVDEFSKLQDPFEPRADYRISLRFNDEPVPIPAIDALLFKHAHAVVEADYSIDDEGVPRLRGRVDYRQHRRQHTFEQIGAHLLAAAGSPRPSALNSLGPFRMTLYWFNRQILTAIDGIGDRKAVQQLQARWAGGLMVFRDGFRVHPYGNPDDDWINLDRKALASAGFKVNRRQIIGRVEITSAGNPCLVDQTNREGLRDCEEKRALVSLLRHVLETQFRTFLNAVDKEVRARVPVSFDDLVDHFTSSAGRSGVA